MSFQVSLENCQGLRTPDGGGGSFHQPGTVNENVLERDFVLLCDGVFCQAAPVSLQNLFLFL